jgi:hypothetical protein
MKWTANFGAAASFFQSTVHSAEIDSVTYCKNLFRQQLQNIDSHKPRVDLSGSF